MLDTVMSNYTANATKRNIQASTLLSQPQQKEKKANSVKEKDMLTKSTTILRSHIILQTPLSILSLT